MAVTKTSTGSGDWNTASTWSPASVPADGDDIIIQAGHTITVNFNSPVYDNMTITVSGTIDVPNGRKINMSSNGEFQLLTGGTLTGGNGGSKLDIGTTTVWDGGDPDLLGEAYCIESGCFVGVLPIILSYFETTFEDDKVVIKWATFSQVNNDYFVIERSGDLLNWESIDTVDGEIYKNEFIEYELIDRTPLVGVSYYRLKQIDIDGSVTYFHVEAIDPSRKEGALSVYPNPASSILVVEKEDVLIDHITISDHSGLVKQMFHYDHLNKIIFDVEHLENGVYHLSLENESTYTTTTFLIEKK